MVCNLSDAGFLSGITRVFRIHFFLLSILAEKSWKGSTIYKIFRQTLGANKKNNNNQAGSAPVFLQRKKNTRGVPPWTCLSFTDLLTHRVTHRCNHFLYLAWNRIQMLSLIVAGRIQICNSANHSGLASGKQKAMKQKLSDL